LGVPVWQSLALGCACKRALSILPIGVILAAGKGLMQNEIKEVRFLDRPFFS